MSQHDDRVIALGRELLASSRARRTSLRQVSWLDELFRTLVKSAAFRVQALRFVDVMPSLGSDASLVKHYREYFPADMEMPGLLRWGVVRAGRSLSSKLLAAVVRKSVAALGGNFLAGESLEQVLETVHALGEQGIPVSLDRLGEATISEREAETYASHYMEAIRVGRGDLKELADPGFASALNLSIKLSSLDSQIAPVNREKSIDVISARLRPLMREAIAQGISLTLDMEQYGYKPIVLSVFMTLLCEPEFRDWPGASIAIQAYLRDAEQDLAELIEWARRRAVPVGVRLVRGAYWDEETLIARQQEWPVPVWQQKSETDRCYENCLQMLLKARPTVHAAIATHNVFSIASAMQQVDRAAARKGDFEFQMLYGMAEGLRASVIERGYPMRLYLPYGELLPGMAYLVRRLLENSSSQSMLRMLDMEDEAGEAPGRTSASLPGSEAVPAPGNAPGGFRNTPLRRFVLDAEHDAFRGALEKVRAQLGDPCPSLDGREKSDANAWITSVNPAHPTQVVGQVMVAGSADAERALQRARGALGGWSAMPVAQRAGLIERIAEALLERRDEFAAWQVFEAGKSWTEADADVAEAVDFLGYYAREAQRLELVRRRDNPGETNRMGYRPLGVGLVLPPWNFPLAIPVGMIAAALVTGNTVLFKPSSLTPVIACRFTELCREAGLPDGVLDLLPGRGADVGEYLVKHPDVRFIAFTGSQDVGLRICRLAAEGAEGQTHIKRVIAEMGGKNAIIVDEDADLDDAVKGVVQSAFGYQGQKCSACSRVIPVGDVQDRFLERLVEATSSLRIGDPVDPASFMGPVIDKAAQARIRDWIGRGEAVAARAYHVAAPEDDGGYYIGPVILDDVPPASDVAQEEIFGPVLSVLRAADFEQALEIANNVRYALTGGLYSRSPVNIRAAIDRFEVGNLYINRRITRAMVDRQPFGGYKLSGMGYKAGGPDYLLQFVHARSVTENTLRRGFAPD